MVLVPMQYVRILLCSQGILLTLTDFIKHSSTGLQEGEWAVELEQRPVGRKGRALDFL